ncbi:MAG: hypothetical protein L6Q57_00265 [Alphaproteobacteria bacterium]|nr:hypothetical protein [Alphaproteobacteria bacterium]
MILITGLAAGLLVGRFRSKDGFVYNGAPVDVQCVFGLMGALRDPAVQEQVLSSCDSPDLRILEDHRGRPDEHGFLSIKTAYAGSEDEAPEIYQGYKMLGMTAPGVYAIQTWEYTGGSGNFSAVALLRLADDWLSLVRVLAVGDRCNGGIVEARVAHGAVVYSIFLTPPDILTLAGEGQGIEAYKDLEASAMSCFGTAHYRGDSLVAIELYPDATLDIDSEWTKKYRYQACFNDHVKAVLAMGMPALMNLDQAREFARGFYKACVNH